MKEDVVQRRMAAFITADWYGQAKKTLEERVKNNKEGQATDLFVL
jgi:hypothetical protein